MKKRNLAAVLSVFSLLLSAGCEVSGENINSTEDSEINSAEVSAVETSTEPEEKIVVRIGDMRTQYPVKAANELGYFDEAFGENVEVELYTFGSGPELIEALAAGEIDLSGSFGSTAVIAGIANGYPITVINGTTTRVEGPKDTHAIVTSVDSGIDTIEDIAGHSFGLQIGSGEYTAFNVILDRHGLKEGDYELANLSNADAYTTLLAGRVDAAVTIEPYITKLVDTGDYKVIGWNSEYDGGGGLQIANSEFAKEYPDLVADFLRAYIDVTVWAHESEENEETVLQIVADQVGTDAEDLKTQFEQDNLYFGYQEEDVQIIQDNIPYLLEQGTILKEVNLIDYVDFSFLEEAGYKDYYLQFLNEGEE